MREITQISVSALKVHPKNQDYFDEITGEDYERFKKSIANEGIITPLIVAPDMTIVSGHQRYKAAKDLGIKLVPVIINEELDDEEEKMRKLLASNFGRLKNNPMKQSRVISEYEKLLGITHGGSRDQNDRLKQSDIAKQLGINETTLKRLKRLQKLSPELQDLVERGELNYTTAVTVYSKLPQELQTQLIKEIGENQIIQLSQKKAEELVHKRFANIEEKEKKIEIHRKQLEIERSVLEEEKQKSKSEIENLKKLLDEKEDRIRSAEEKANTDKKEKQKLSEKLVKAQSDLIKATDVAKNEEKIEAEKKIKEIKLLLEKTDMEKEETTTQLEMLKKEYKDLKDNFDQEVLKSVAEKDTLFDSNAKILREIEQMDKSIGASVSTLKSLYDTAEGNIRQAVFDRLKGSSTNFINMMNELIKYYGITNDNFQTGMTSIEEYLEKNKEIEGEEEINTEQTQYEKEALGEMLDKMNIEKGK